MIELLHSARTKDVITFRPERRSIYAPFRGSRLTFAEIRRSDKLQIRPESVLMAATDVCHRQ